jgi:hypothetical protein
MSPTGVETRTDTEEIDSILSDEMVQKEEPLETEKTKSS